jgi:hypothetical protein
MNKKTREEVEQLKQDWLNDACYDLTGIEGFEEYEKELKEFEKKQIAIWEKEDTERQKEKHKTICNQAKELKIKDTELYKLVLKQQETIEQLKEALYSVCDGETYRAYRILQNYSD